jgi:hypothetical protein
VASDADGSGKLQLGEFKELLSLLALLVQILTLLLVASDADGSGKLELGEFKTLATQLIETAKEIQEDVNMVEILSTSL